MGLYRSRNRASQFCVQYFSWTGLASPAGPCAADMGCAVEIDQPSAFFPADWYTA